MSTEVLYRCPGQTHFIDRAQHLGRLAAGFPDCRACAHRDDTTGLSSQTTARFAETIRRAAPSSIFLDEGLGGLTLNQLGPAEVRRLAAAQGICLLRGRSVDGPAPTVVLGGDERSLTAELFAAAVEGLRTSGCRVVDLGGVTAGCLVWAARELRADAGLLVGNASGEPHAVSLQLWGARAEPWSAGGKLDEVRAVFESGSPRPVRRSGPLERWHAEPSFLDERRELFYALRPLGVVLDSSSLPLVRQLDHLLAATGVETYPVERPPAAPVYKPQSPDSPRGYVERRLAMISRQVREQGADLGLWIDGDGQSCRLVDQRGRLLPAEKLLTIISPPALAEPVAHALAARAGKPPVAREVAREAASETTAPAPSPFGIPNSEFRIGPTRQAAYQLLHGSQLKALCDGTGRIWFSQPEPTVDALLTLAALLTRLSESDRPLSAF